MEEKKVEEVKPDNHKMAFYITDKGFSFPIRTDAFCEMESCPIHGNDEPILDNIQALLLCLMCKHNKKVSIPGIINEERSLRETLK